MKCIFVIVAIAICLAEAANMKDNRNLCMRINCDTFEKVNTCATNGKIYKTFENTCAMRQYNCNNSERFATVDFEVCQIINELGFMF